MLFSYARLFTYLLDQIDYVSVIARCDPSGTVKKNVGTGSAGDINADSLLNTTRHWAKKLQMTSVVTHATSAALARRQEFPAAMSSGMPKASALAYVYSRDRSTR
jgi:hypothetical protein